jgi:hypothetical protein
MRPGRCMKIEHESFDLENNNSEMLIIKTSRELLFNFSALSVHNFSIKSIRPHARFLFARLKPLSVNHIIDELSVEEVRHTLEQFAEWDIDFVEVSLTCLKTNYDLPPLTFRRVHGLEIYGRSSVIDSIDALSNDLIELKVNFDKNPIDTRVFELLPNLQVLECSNVNRIAPNTFANAKPLLKLDLSLKWDRERVDRVQPSSLTGLGQLVELNLSNMWLPLRVDASLFSQVPALAILKL